MDQDWTEAVTAAPAQSRTHTFVLGDAEMSSSLLMTTSTPATIRAASAGAALKSRPAARSKIPAATARRSHGAALEASCSNGALAAAASEEAAAAVRLVEDSLSPLARANSQISESIAQLEKSLLTLKAATFAETPNSD